VGRAEPGKRWDRIGADFLPATKGSSALRWRSPSSCCRGRNVITPCSRAYRTLEEAGDAVSAVICQRVVAGRNRNHGCARAGSSRRGSGTRNYPPWLRSGAHRGTEGPREVVDADRGAARQDHRRLPSASRPARRRDAEERVAIWKGRKSAFSAVGRLSPDFIVQDGVVPRRRLGEALRRIGELAGESVLRVANVFTRGTEICIRLILFNGREGRSIAAGRGTGGIDPENVRGDGRLDHRRARGGHGKEREYLPTMFSADEIDCMRRLRAAFDPLGIANPGKMFPHGRGAGVATARPPSAGKSRVISRE